MQYNILISHKQESVSIQFVSSAWQNNTLEYKYSNPLSKKKERDRERQIIDPLSKTMLSQNQNIILQNKYDEQLAREGGGVGGLSKIVVFFVGGGNYLVVFILSQTCWFREEKVQASWACHNSKGMP